MKVGFNNIHNCIIQMDDFILKWRFTEEKYDVLPQEHLNQLKPLNTKGARFLWDFIVTIDLHSDVPFKENFFSSIDKAKMTDDNEQTIKKWLYHRGIAFNHEVFLSWQPDFALIVPWKVFIKYFDSFYYPMSDDLLVFDSSMNWALLGYHESELYFGSNQKFIPSNEFQDHDFLF